MLLSLLLGAGLFGFAVPLLSDQCSTTHFLNSGETREFRFGSGRQFRAELSCVFVFVGPMEERLQVQAHDVAMSCPGNELRVRDFAGGNLTQVATTCSNNTNLVTLTSNIAVLTLVSHDNSSERLFWIAVSSASSRATTVEPSTAQPKTTKRQTG